MDGNWVGEKKLCYININQIYQTLGEQICRGLPALHAFTGFDYVSSFS